MKKFSTFKKIQKNNNLKNAELIREQTEVVSNEVEETIISSDVSKFFSKIFEARQMAHVYHLQVKGDMGSHAAHTALNEYYDELLEFLDDLIEVYQGQYGVIENYESIDTSETKSKDKIEYFLELNSYIKENRKSFSEEDTHLHNIIDEIVALTYKLIYKLKFNK